MTKYEYIRIDNGDGTHDIDNPERTNSLSIEIEIALPGKSFGVRCEYLKCHIEFDQALTDTEKTMLDGVVSAHKTNA